MVATADPLLGPHHHHLEGVEQGGHDRAPHARGGPVDQHQPLQGDTELGGGEQSQRRDADDRDHDPAADGPATRARASDTEPGPTVATVVPAAAHSPESSPAKRVAPGGPAPRPSCGAGHGRREDQLSTVQGSVGDHSPVSNTCSLRASEAVTGPARLLRPPAVATGPRTPCRQPRTHRLPGDRHGSRYDRAPVDHDGHPGHFAVAGRDRCRNHCVPPGCRRRCGPRQAGCSRAA